MTASKKQAKPNPLERERVLAILQYLQAKYPKWCWTRQEPPGAVRARAYRGKGYAKKMPEDAWGDGVADILGIGPAPGDFPSAWCRAIAFEVKRITGRQRLSQMYFEERWKKARGLYSVVHDVDDVIAAMKAWGL